MKCLLLRLILLICGLEVSYFLHKCLSMFSYYKWNEYSFLKDTKFTNLLSLHKVCGGTTGAGKAALSQQGHCNGTAASEQEETEEDTGHGCPRRKCDCAAIM